MDWYNILTLVGGALLGGGGGWIFFAQKYKEAKASAYKAETEALDARHDYLQERIDKTEALYSEQGKLLDQVRSEMLDLKKALAAKDERIAELEAENRKLSKRVSTLEKELAVTKHK